jgi:hypothetical protein
MALELGSQIALAAIARRLSRKPDVLNWHKALSTIFHAATVSSERQRFMRAMK